MKKVKFLAALVILISFIGVTQTNAQSYVERGSEYKPLIYEVDGEQYMAYAHVDYQFEHTPSLNLNWVSHGYLFVAFALDGEDWVELNYIPLPKSAVKADDPRPEVGEEKVVIKPTGEVTVSAHLKDINPWW